MNASEEWELLCRFEVNVRSSIKKEKNNIFFFSPALFSAEQISLTFSVKSLLMCLGQQ